MRKIFPSILASMFLMACSVSGEIHFDYDEATAIYEYRSSAGNDSIFFEHPVSAKVTEEGAVGGHIAYQDCNVSFGRNVVDWPNADELVDGDKTFQSIFSEQKALLKYRGIRAGVSFEIDENTSTCMDFVNALVNSVSDEPVNFNNKYRFSVKLFQDWTNDRLDDRIVMNKLVTPEKPRDFDELKEVAQRPYLPFPVEIGIIAKDSPYKDLSELVLQEYAGYTVEFLTWGNVYGVKVGDQDGDNSFDHFYFMSEDGRILYEAYLKVWSIHYNEFADTFKGVVSTVELF